MVSLALSRIVDATITAVIQKIDGLYLQVVFGKNQTALVNLQPEI